MEGGIKGFAADGSTMLDQAAICLLNPGGGGRPVTVRVHERLMGCTLRVTHRGRTLPSITETDERHGGDTTLVIPIPRPVDIPPEELVGCAWVYAVLDRDAESQQRSVDQAPSGPRNRRSGRHGGATSDPPGDADLVQIGASVPLLLIPDTETAQEISDAVRTIRNDLGDAQANRFVTRLGNCVAPATINEEDLGAAMEVTKVLDLRLTERMLLQSMFAARQEEGARANRDGGSEAGGDDSDSAAAAIDGGVDGDDSDDAAAAAAITSSPKFAFLGGDGCCFHDDVVKMLRRDPGLSRAWTNTTKQWNESVWMICLACFAIHGVTTLQYCNLSWGVYVRTGIGQVICARLSRGWPTYLDGFLTRRGLNDKRFYLYAGGAALWYGYGEGGSYVRRENMHGQCALDALHYKAIVCICAMMVVYSAHPFAHRHLRGLVTTCAVSFTAPFVVNHALGLAEYNGFWDVNVGAAFPTFQTVCLSRLPWDTAVTGKIADVCASAVLVFAAYWVCPLACGCFIQREYVRRLMPSTANAPGGRPRRRLNPL